MPQQDDQSVSNWTGFNILTRGDIYLPTINAPATQMSTVNEALNQSLSIMQCLDLTKIVCVFDQALYAKAVEITWKHAGKFQNIIIRLGVFHTICTLLAIIGKPFQDAVHSVWHDRRRLHCWGHGWPQVQQGSATTQALV